MAPLAVGGGPMTEMRSPGGRVEEARPAQRRLLLILVAFHPPESHVQGLRRCLEALPPEIGYAVVVNDHRVGEPVDQLRAGADQFLTCSENLGYGRAINRMVSSLPDLPQWLGALNTDLSWRPGTFETLLAWLSLHADVVLAVPEIQDPDGRPQLLCKRDPSLLALVSRRFLPKALKPSWLRRYDARFQMAEQDLGSPLDVPYLSGCCMLIRSAAFQAVGGFDRRFFLYLEDADLSRRLRSLGRCIHLPVAAVRHHWGRGNHHSLWLTMVNIQSVWIYFSQWGWRWW